MLPSASRLDLARRCMGSATLPGVEEERGGAASEGVVLHRYLEDARHDREAALRQVPDELRERAEAIDLTIIPEGAESEVALGYDAHEDRTVRYALGAHRAYPDDGLWHGTADLVGMRAGRVLVYDFKTGWAEREARQAMQLRFLALAASRLGGADEAEVAMLYEREGRWEVDRAELDALDLEATRGLLLEMKKEIALADPPLRAGSHCGRCPALRLCPAQTGLVRALVGEDLAHERVVALSLEEAGALYDRACAVEEVVGRAKEALRAMAGAMPEGLPLPDGRSLRAVRWSTTLKSQVARNELAALTDALRARGEITKGQTTQLRVVGKAVR